MPRTPALTHAWMATQHQADSIDFVLLAVAEAAGNSRLLRINSRPSGKGFATPHTRAGNSAELRTEFDQAVLDYLVAGYTQIRRLEQPGELDLIAAHGKMATPAMLFDCCTHLHGGLAEWGMPRRTDPAPTVEGDPRLVRMLRPQSGTHGLLSILPGQAGQALSFSVTPTKEHDSLQMLAETLSAAAGKTVFPSWLGEVVVAPQKPAQLFDLLSYDGTDLRATPWAQRWALAEQLVAELERPDLLEAATIDRRADLTRATDKGLLWTRSDAAWNERQHQ